VPTAALVGKAFVTRARVVLPINENAHLSAAASQQARRLGVHLQRVTDSSDVRRALQATASSHSEMEGVLAVFDAYSRPFVVLDGDTIKGVGVEAALLDAVS